jgi:hypothetical protein
LGWKTATGNSRISGMEEPSTTLAQPPPRKPIKVSVLFAPITVPLLLLAATISIPWTCIQKWNQRRKERRFAEEMKNADRLMDWPEFKQAIQSGAGTAIGEYLSPKGPFRLWWTAEDIPAVSPHQWQREQHVAWMEPEFLPFFKWCIARYTNPQSGAARLVVVPERERKQLNVMLNGSRFVSTCSFRSLREGGQPRR